jgi:hypothetical protein
MRTAPQALPLPVSYYREIGRIITLWAHVEWRLRQIAYRLLEIGPKPGRIAIREPRATDYLEMIVDLMELKKLSIPPKMPELWKDIDKCVLWRDRLAHNIWLRDPKSGEIVIQVTRGKWERPAGAKPKKGEKQKSRKVVPEGIPVTVPKLGQIRADIINVGAILEALYISINRALTPSPDKSPSPCSPQDRHMDHVARKLPLPRRSSRKSQK